MDPPTPTHTCRRGRGGQLGVVKASRGQMAVDWQPVHLASRLAQPGYLLFNYIYLFIHFVVLGQRRCRPALLPILLIWFKPGAPTWSVQSKGSDLSSTSRGPPIRADVHTEFNHGQVFALRPTLPLLTPAESLEGESPHW